MKQAARKRHGLRKSEIEARYNDEIGEIELFEFLEVVEEVTDPEAQISFDQGLARSEYDPEAEVGDEIGVKMDTSPTSAASSRRPPSR